MFVKLVLAAVSAVALCCAQSDPTPAAKVAAPEASPPQSDLSTGAASAPEGNAQTTPAGATPKPGPQVVQDSTPATKAAETKAPEGLQPEPPKSAAAAADPRNAPYLIGALDVLVVKVWGNQQLSGVYDVHQDGMMSMPLVGDVKAEGLTTNQVAAILTKKLDDCCIRTPVVNVELGRNNSKHYYVYGEVARGGEFPLSRAMTVMDALSDVGGFREFANLKKIRIQRKVNGEAKEFLFNYKDVSHGKHTEQDIWLQNGDRIFVGQ